MANTIKDYINTNDNEQIRIQRMQRNDPYWPSYDTVWEGSLHEVPEDLLDLEVVDAGWLMTAQMHTLILPPLHRQKEYQKGKQKNSMVR